MTEPCLPRSLARHAAVRRMAAMLACLSVVAPAVARDMFVDYGPMWNDYEPKRGEPFGCIAGSLGRSRENPATVGVFLLVAHADRAESGGKVSIKFRDSKKVDVTDGDETRDVFQVCLRPGRYRIATFGLSDSSTRNFLPTREVNIPIEVVAGQATYIGSFTGYLDTQPSRCTGVPYIMRVEVRADRQEQDVAAIAAEKRKARLPIVVQLPDYRGHEPLMFVCDSLKPVKVRREAKPGGT